MIGYPMDRPGMVRPPTTSDLGPPPPGHQTWDPLLLTSGGHHWRPVKTCSFRDHLSVASVSGH